jgi:hypothetical protein
MKRSSRDANTLRKPRPFRKSRDASSTVKARARKGEGFSGRASPENARKKRPDGKNAGPYPGLAAFGEDDAGIFFGREADIVAGLAKLRLMRKRRSPRL